MSFQGPVENCFEYTALFYKSILRGWQHVLKKGSFKKTLINQPLQVIMIIHCAGFLHWGLGYESNN